MTASPPNSSKARKSLNPAAFARFLEFLSPDTDEASRRYTLLHDKLTGFFRLKGISDPVNAADETIDRAAIKITEGAPVSDVNKYCAGIARNIAKERFRRAQREDSAYQMYAQGIAVSANEEVERIEQVLKPCFEELTAEEQALLLAYCQVIQGRARAEHRKRLAEAMQTTVLALRMRVTRLRSNLADCVTRHSRSH